MSTTPSPPLNAQSIVRALQEFQIAATERQIGQIQRYLAMLLAWNDKINLTAIRDPLEILHRHFCESMFIAHSVPILTGRLADVGSGGGFPGLPLKIFSPDLHVFLVEANVRKATFLAEVVRELELKDTRVLVSRYEELSEELTPLDYACSRAFGQFEEFLSWAGSPQISANRVVLWLGAQDADAVRKTGGWSWHEPIAIPHSLRRFVLVGDRVDRK